MMRTRGEGPLAWPQLKPPILLTMPDAADMPDALMRLFGQIKSGQGLFHARARAGRSARACSIGLENDRHGLRIFKLAHRVLADGRRGKGSPISDIGEISDPPPAEMEGNTEIGRA